MVLMKILKLCLSVLMVESQAMQIERASAPVTHGEGPLWDAENQVLYHVDIPDQKIYRLDPASGKVTSAYFECGPVGAVVKVEDSTNKFIVACGTKIVLATWDGKSTTKPKIQQLASLDTDRNDTRVNDGKCDPAGRFWIGTMGEEINQHIEPNRGTLYRYGQNMDPEVILTPVSISNGLAWDKQNKTMYYIDSMTRKIVSYAYDNESGNIDIDSKKVLFDLEYNNLKGVPDGMTIDENDNLWIAIFGGSAVIHVDSKSGKLLKKIDMPVERITSVAWGGPNFDILYVTTSSFGLSESQKRDKPDSGSVFTIKNLNVRGYPAMKFRLDDSH